ncbi:histidinol-phosphate transaminase [Spongorhabdus nitratireducens]
MNGSLASRLVPENIKSLEPYQSARRTGGKGHLWLNANELEQCCQYSDVHTTPYNRYPDFLPHELEAAYKKYCGTEAEVMAVRGADEAIDLLVRTFCQPGADQIMICPPTYGMYEFCANAVSVNVKKVPLTEGFELDLQSLKSELSDTKLLFLCSPNNPTGNVIDKQTIEGLLQAAQDTTLVVVDEAYIEFAPDTSMVDLLEQYPNLVVIRTLSKAFGLAAVRCGFLIANPDVMTYIARLVAPYPIPDPCAEIAISALSPDGLSKMQEQTEDLIETRDWFISQIRNSPLVECIYPSATNFVLIKGKGPEDLYDLLSHAGIVARNQTHEPALNRCVRITIGSRASMAEVIKVLTQVKAHQA